MEAVSQGFFHVLLCIVSPKRSFSSIQNMNNLTFSGLKYQVSKLEAQSYLILHGLKTDIVSVKGNKPFFVLN